VCVRRTAGSGDRVSQWRAAAKAADEGINTVKGPANYCLSPRVGYTYYIHIYRQARLLACVCARVRVCTSRSAGPFNISQIRVTFSRNRFPARPLRRVHNTYVCVRASRRRRRRRRRRRPRKFYGCKIFFITREGLPAAEQPHCTVHMRIVVCPGLFASPVYCLLSCGAIHTRTRTYVVYTARCIMRARKSMYTSRYAGARERSDDF